MGIKTVSIHEAKKHLSKLIEKASQGESFVITKAGKPMVQVIPVQPKSRIGMLEGMYEIPDDFNDMMADEIEAMFNGDEL